MSDVEAKTDKITASVHRCEALVTSMDGSLGRIEADFAVLSCSVPRLSRAVPLLWFTLAGAVALLAVCAGG